ncbi:MAG: hypothetical protein II539_04180, partial [Muribaculaceae bacterium]|nr:hypothetical protein [Muribaculaceae bacterium]
EFLWGEPVDYSPLFSVSGMNAGYMATKMLEDNLTNFGGYGVEDHVPTASCPGLRVLRLPHLPPV